VLESPICDASRCREGFRAVSEGLGTGILSVVPGVSFSLHGQLKASKKQSSASQARLSCAAQCGARESHRCKAAEKCQASGFLSAVLILNIYWCITRMTHIVHRLRLYL